ncbi:isoprenylcysteine carboxylmethyltransferase family protein [Candidatus Gottesmanbacteria bacterium]|nr:isoprenylcysteine carboxylmethyltransferase family protein [Candidatus Gottesmanbacteria bacterium]
MIDYFLTSSNLFTRILLCTGIIALGFTWGIRGGRKSWIPRNSTSRVNFFFQLTIILPQLLGVKYLPLPETSITPIIQLIGLVIFYLGVILSIWSRMTMGKAWGMPGSWDTKREKKLIINGPFKYTKNPIYVGLLFVFFGLELALNSYLSLATILLYFYFQKMAEKEEKILEKEFGKEYLEYKKTTPKFL